MFKSCLLTLVLLITLLITSQAYALSPTGSGVFIVSNCNQITFPVANKSYCLVGNTMSVWNGSAWSVGLISSCNGNATLLNGAIVVSNTCITGTKAIVLNANGDPNFVYTSALTSGGFMILSQSGLDGNLVYWNQAP